ncbi:hypothetical protein KR044_008250 [Drosophila immigrans]|nr:hypothetical protein KR044_008250 [Drosophila immigrans]
MRAKMFKWLIPFALGAAVTLGADIICLKIKQMRNKRNNGEVVDVLIFNELTRSQDFPNSVMQLFLSYIKQAQYSIDLAIYTFTNLEVFQALMEAHDRGVRLRIVTDLTMMTSTLTKMIDLKQGGFDIRCPASQVMMHHKFMLIDGPKSAMAISRQANPHRSLLLSGSVNWTNQGFHGNWENCAVMASNGNRMVIAYETEFERMWNTFTTV